jgi:hypothetical protein
MLRERTKTEHHTMKVTLYTWTTDDQNGMNTQILTSKGALKAAMLDTIGSTDADRADCMRLARFGGRVWEEMLENWREAQMSDQNYYSWGQQEVELLPCSDDNVMRVPVVSSQHVTKEDGARLMAAEQRDVLATLYDQTGHIVHWGDDKSVDAAFPADRFSDAFRALVAHFDAQGYTYLRIDAHGEVVAGLPVFDW